MSKKLRTLRSKVLYIYNNLSTAQIPVGLKNQLMFELLKKLIRIIFFYLKNANNMLD